MNLVQVLRHRECGLPYDRKAALNCREDGFLLENRTEDFKLNTDNIVSTIAISFSVDGFYVATTHGDHTVKVFNYRTGRLFRIFEGHPRTPWTVKFHPSFRNVVASGCLGCEVRVWDISLNCCIRYIKYGYSIISLSFHPLGDVIAVASGPNLYMWQWADHQPHIRSGSSASISRAGSDIDSDSGIRNGSERSESNPPSITSSSRASSGGIGFGNSIYRVASYSNRSRFSNRDRSGSGCGSSRAEGSIGSGVKFDLDQDLIPPRMAQIKHRSGRNIRAVIFHPNGQHVFTAAVPSDPDTDPALAPHTTCRLHCFTMEHLRTDDSQAVIDLSDLPVLIKHVHLYSDGGLDISLDGRFLFTCAMLNLDMYQLDRGVLCARECPSPISPEEELRVSTSESAFSLPVNMMVYGDTCADPSDSSKQVGAGAEWAGGSRQAWMKSVNSNGSSLLSHPGSSLNPDFGLQFGSGPNSAFGQVDQRVSFSRRRLESALFNLRQSELMGVDNTPRHSQSSIKSGSSVEFLTDLGISGSPPSTTPPSFPLAKSVNHNEAICTPKKGKTARIAIGAGLPGKSAAKGYLCLFRLSMPDETIGTSGSLEAIRVSLVRAQPLPATLMKAVTSAKLSPTGRLALVGYGIRTEGRVVDHPHSNVACEVFNLRDMKSLSSFLDDIDEVNIAQFHPNVGHGLLYGTKRGKVRRFMGSC